MINLEEKINKLVTEGKLPLAFYNSSIVVNSDINADNKKRLPKRPKLNYFNEKYKQVEIATGYLGRLNTKIYDLY